MFSWLGRALAALIRFSGAAAVVRNTVARRRVSIILYHDPPARRLEEHMAFVTRRYTPIALDLLVDAIATGDWASLPPRSLVVTFDDGRAGNRAALEVMRRHGVHPAIFVCTARIGDAGFLAADDVAAMAAGAEFGSHGRTHAPLPACDYPSAREEIAASRAEVQALAGAPCRHFAFPLGAYSERDVRLVAEAGYDSARTVDIGWNGPGTDPFRLRILTRDPHTTTMLAAELAGLQWLARLVNRTGDLRGRRLFGSGR